MRTSMRMSMRAPDTARRPRGGAQEPQLLELDAEQNLVEYVDRSLSKAPTVGSHAACAHAHTRPQTRAPILTKQKGNPRVLFFWL